MESELQSIRERVAAIRAELAPYPNATLSAVVKTRTAEEINFAIRECGISVIGENRVQELLAHYDALDRSASVHFIGTLQKNKVKYIIDKVDMIESLDSVALAEEIEKRAAAIGRTMPVLIEINIGREAAKGGILPEDLAPFCDALRALPHLRPAGLMTIAPVCTTLEESAVYFAQVRRLRDDVFAPRFPEVMLPMLSMGMSGNYRVALREGSDLIRLGEAIFGKRRLPAE